MSTPHTNYFTTYSGGWHNSLRFKYHSTDSNGDYVCAAYDNNDILNDGTGNKIKFNPTTGVWSDVDTSAPPVQFTSSSTWANTTSVSGYPNKLWIWNGSTNLNLEMDTPSWAQASTDQYGRLPSTAVTKTFRKSRAAYRIDYPQDHVLEVDESTVNGGYDTFNVPSEIYCLRLRDTHYEVQADYNLFLANKLPLTRNGKTYLDFMFGMTIPDVLDSTYRYISLQASAPYQIASGKWYVNYTTHGWNTSTLMYDELITGYSHNPAHSVLVIYNITDNIWQSQLGQITSYDWTDPPPEYIDPGDVVTTYSNITVSCVSPNDTEQWNGFSNLSFTTTNLFRFNVEKETNVYSNDLPPQNEVEVATNGGGKPDRYPLIMTNLFNRNRSIYSIGMTHKDTWDLFL